MIEFPYYLLKQKNSILPKIKMLCRDKITEIHQAGFMSFVSLCVLVWVFVVVDLGFFFFVCFSLIFGLVLFLFLFCVFVRLVLVLTCTTPERC